MIADVHITLGSIIGYIIAGAIIGALARLLVPGRQSMSVLATIGALQAPPPTDWLTMAITVGRLALSSVLTYLVYLRRPPAAIALIVLWGASYFYSWVMAGWARPPLGLIGLLIWYGLYRGARGTRSLMHANQRKHGESHHESGKLEAGGRSTGKS